MHPLNAVEGRDDSLSGQHLAGASHWRARLWASALHLSASLVVALIAAIAVLFVWYPGDYREFAGGRGLLFLVAAVDVVSGPLLTLVVFNPAKGRRHLHRDLAVIAVIQLAALGYGIHTTFQARPVAIVFEVDRFRLVSAQDVQQEELLQAPAAFQALSVTGPHVIGARVPAPGPERTEALMRALDGIDVGVRPKFWVTYDEVRDRAMQRSRPVTQLLDHHVDDRHRIEQALEKSGLLVRDARFLPLMARGDWVVLMSPEGDVAGFAPFDGFF